MSTFNNNNYAGGNSSKKYLDANNDQSTNYDDLGSTFGAIFGGPLGAVAGNLIGQQANYLTSNKMAEDQFERQKELQKRANDMNMQNAGRMAQVQTLGMQNAGMNPAGTQFTSAPTQQQGAAPMPTVPHLGNIFQGVAELIAAAKAPTEIEKIVAETEKTQAETEKTATQTEEITANIDKIIADTQNAKNANEIFQNENQFIKDQTSAIYTNYIDQLEASGQWDKLSEKTKITLTDLANGDLELDIGKLEGLNKILASELNLSETDKNILSNTKQMIVDLNQIKDKNVMKSLEKLPEATFNKLKAEMSEIYQKIKNLKASKTGIDIENYQKILHDPNYMISTGMTDELKTYVGVESAKDIRNFVNDLIRAKTLTPRRNKTVSKTPKTLNSKTTTTDYGL